MTETITLDALDTRHISLYDFFALSEKMGLLQQYLQTKQHPNFWDNDFTANEMNELTTSKQHMQLQETLYTKFGKPGKQ